MITKVRIVKKGGQGSGFHGHSGRPGQVGGSSSERTLDTYIAEPEPIVDTTTFKGPEYTKEFWKRIGYDYGEEPPATADARAHQMKIFGVYVGDNFRTLRSNYYDDEEKQYLENLALDYGQEYADIIDLIYKADKSGDTLEFERLRGVAIKYLAARANNTLAELLQNEPVRIRADKMAAESILLEGRFKSQFETQNSKGTFSPTRRNAAEHYGLGTPYDIPDNQRPIYGYVTSGGFGVSQYGSVEFVLKEAVKERTSVTSGDSLGNFQFKQSVGVPFYAADKVPAMTDSSDALVLGDPPADYVEAQIHGGVSVSDVSKVVIHARDAIDKNHYEYFIKEFVEPRGIPWEWDERIDP